MKPNTSSLADLQMAFADAIRNQQTVVLPTLSAERMQVYQRLFFNNVSSFIDNAFPVLTRIYCADAWLALKQRFFAEYRCHSPYFLHIAEQFVDFLQQSTLTAADLPFVAELAHYEWAELYIATLNSNAPPMTMATDVASAPLRLSEASLLTMYHYPVQYISENFQPTHPSEPQFFLIYRNLLDEVSFVQLNHASVLLLHHLAEQPGNTLQQLTTQIQPQLPAFDTTQLFQYALPFFTELGVKGALTYY